MTIQSFADRDTEDFFYDGTIRKGCGWAGVKAVAARKLDFLNDADQLFDLRQPPGNHLEALKRDLAGLHSIRINDQWRVIFRWTDSGPAEVKIGDYH